MSKNKMVFIASLVCVVCAALLLCSCSVEKKDTSSDLNNKETVPNSNEASDYIIQCIIDPISEDKLAEKDNYTMFEDDEFYYYIIKIGQMQYIPVNIDQMFYYDGVSVRELEFTTSTIDINTVKETIQSQVESHTEWSNTFAIPNMSYGKLSLGSIVTNYQYGSSDYFELNELETINGTAKVSSTVLREKFDSNRPEGNWAYVFFANVDVYASIITDKDFNVVDVSTQNKIINGNYDFQFLGSNKTLPDSSEGKGFKVDLDCEPIKSILSNKPSINITGKYDIIQDSYMPTYCGKDNNYTPKANDKNANMVDPKIIQITFENIFRDETNCFIVLENSTPILNVKLVQDINNIPTNKSKAKSIVCNDAEKKISAFGSVRTVGSKIGLGAVIAQINYKDNQVRIVNACNIFSGKNVPETINLLDNLGVDIENISLIKSIDFVIVFEIKTTEGVLSIPDYTNWRYDFNICFAD